MQDMWNQRFSAEEYYYGKAPNPYFKDRIGQLPPGSILMPAEGEGRNGVYAARLGWNVTAVDFSEAGRKKALELAKENNVTLEYLLGDIAAFDFGKEQYDVAKGNVGGTACCLGGIGFDAGGSGRHDHLQHQGQRSRLGHCRGAVCGHSRRAPGFADQP